MEEEEVHRYNKVVDLAKEMEGERSHIRAAELWDQASRMVNRPILRHACQIDRGRCMSTGGEFDDAKKTLENVVSQMKDNEEEFSEMLLEGYVYLAWNEHYRENLELSMSFFWKAIEVSERNSLNLDGSNIWPFFSFLGKEIERLNVIGDKTGMSLVFNDWIKAVKALGANEQDLEPLMDKMKALGVEL